MARRKFFGYDVPALLVGNTDAIYIHSVNNTKSINYIWDIKLNNTTCITLDNMLKYLSAKRIHYPTFRNWNPSRTYFRNSLVEFTIHIRDARTDLKCIFTPDSSHPGALNYVFIKGEYVVHIGSCMRQDVIDALSGIIITPITL